MMNHRLPSILVTLLGIILSATTVMAASDEKRDPVFVTSAEVLYMESFPVQVELRVVGDLPTPCHEPAWEVTQTETSVDVILWSTFESDAVCTTVLEPVELSIPLGSYETAHLEVTLNGDVVGHVDIDEGVVPTSVTLLGAGWSFGACIGYCAADLRVDGSALVQTGRDREVADPLYVNHGSLTAEGAALRDSILAGLDVTSLQTTYGCPDCADGGAAYVVLGSNVGETRHDMEFGAPPDELADLSVLMGAIMSALEACEDTELVVVAEDCSAVER